MCKRVISARHDLVPYSCNRLGGKRGPQHCQLIQQAPKRPAVALACVCLLLPPCNCICSQMRHATPVFAHATPVFVEQLCAIWSKHASARVQMHSAGVVDGGMHEDNALDYSGESGRVTFVRCPPPHPNASHAAASAPLAEWYSVYRKHCSRRSYLLGSHSLSSTPPGLRHRACCQSPTSRGRHCPSTPHLVLSTQLSSDVCGEPATPGPEISHSYNTAMRLASCYAAVPADQGVVSTQRNHLSRHDIKHVHNSPR
jgi:hypothetical protein